MTENNNLSSLQYKLEWEDHLYELYGDFVRRNNIDEWEYFLRRPELAEKETAEQIAVAVLSYITKYGNISQDIIIAIERVFRYSESRIKYEQILGFEAMEIYINHQLPLKEFPPFDMFDGFNSDKNYDEYLNIFRTIYYEGDLKEPEYYEAAMAHLKSTEITHPYEDLLRCEYLISRGAMQDAMFSLKNMSNGYHKYMALGNLCAQMGDYSEAETWLTEAVKLRPEHLDGQLIADLVMCKWLSNNHMESLEYIERFAAAGYEHIVMPLKKEMLSEIARVLMEKGKEVELVEEELLLIKECYKIFEDYESVIKLSEISREKGFSHESWTVDVAEAYFETGEYDNAQQIIDMVYDGRRQISMKAQLKTREIKARLLFKMGRVKDAYEIMDTVCSHSDCDIKQKHTLAQMYITTGKTKSALRILRSLRLNQPYNIKYIYDMGICFMKEGEYRGAAYMFRQVCDAEPENKDAAFYFIQNIIDDDHEKSLINAKGLLERYQELFSEAEKNYLQGQIYEMEEKYSKAKTLYDAIIKLYDEGKCSDKLLNDSLVRYFVMVEETGGRVGEMEAEILKMLERYPQADELWTYLANFYEEADYETEKIPGCYEKALEANPFNDEALLLLAGIYMENEKADKAVEMYSDMILYTDDKDPYMLRAYYMADIGDYDQARADIRKYEELGGDKNESIELNATLAMLNGEYEYALDAYEQLNKINKGKKAPLYDDMAICMCKMGREKEAVKLLDIACENSGNPVLYKILYDIQVHNGEFKDAKKTVKRYRKACELGRLDEWITLLNTYADLEAGKAMQALAVTSSMIEPEGERLCGILEQLYGKHKSAVKLLSSALKNEPDELDNYIWLSFAHFLNGDSATAAEVAENGLRLFENTYGSKDKYLRCEPLCQYGFLKMMIGEMDEAYEVLQRAANQPTCPEFICRRCYEADAGLGIYHAINGNMLQASQAFDESLKEKPDNTICKTVMKIMLQL